MAGSPAFAELRREAPAGEAEPPGAAWSGDSGTVSQSHSSASGPWEDEAAEDLSLLRRAAESCAACLLPGAGPGAPGAAGAAARPEVAALDAGLEDLLCRVDEFAGMLDMIRGDSSHVVSEGVPRIHARAAEMRRVYGRIDKLEAFVRMVGGRVARLEEHVARAEAELGALPKARSQLLRAVPVPALFHRPPPAPPSAGPAEPPALFRTEDYFPCCGDSPQL
ncbi:LOW QUALITY PROTEIN: biogenesis of lysosome-related organelles complex 1 subunit 4 [Perognathus longimembris pacificus]|uniref:LOW QUALITY PROTEIN: biogenesis of lysosome-related organelles complex 1 subunit 4 n=1 Tax=Perognathus longimembris pacificus TaxID=214514 RepID=UPI00201881B4|nr:LOW QUALITY PROTEIN: biogenesis of lysosome-related organelles complex 1 subunit 4 [Perognathus longimembris pacificus]